MLLAPIGMQGLVHPNAEIDVAKAVRATSIPMILSTISTRSMEAIAQNLDGDTPKWFQLYW